MNLVKKFTSITIVYILVASGLIGMLNLTSDNSVAQLANSPWPCYGGNARHTGLSPYDTSHVNGTLKWSYSFGGTATAYSPAIGNGGTIYLSRGNVLHALNANGSLKWNFTAESTITSSPAIGNDGSIYLGCSFTTSYDSKLLSIWPNGTLKWSFFTGFPIYSHPTIGNDGTIYFGCSDSYGEDSKFYAVNPDGTQKWNYKTSYPVDYSPAIDTDGNIYFTSGTKLFTLDSSGIMKWIYSSVEGLYGLAIGSDGTLYIGSDGQIYAIYSNGTLKWSYMTGNITYSPALGNDGTIYAGYGCAINPDGTMKWSYAFDNANQFSQSNWDGAYSPAIGSDGTIYYSISSSSESFPTPVLVKNGIYAINSNGTLKWMNTAPGSLGFSTTQAKLSSPIIGSDGTVYLYSQNGKLYAFGTANKPGIPQNFQGISGNEKVELSWESPQSDGGSVITGYQIFRGTTSGNTFRYAVVGNTHLYLDTVVTNGIIYYYEIRAVNIIGEGNKTSEISVTPNPTPPSAPLNLQAIAGDSCVNLSWSPPNMTGGSEIINYTIYRGITSGTHTLLTTIGNLLVYTDISTVNDQTYFYKVSAINSVGEGTESIEVSATPIDEITIPSAPQNLQATAGDGQVTLTWTAPSSDGGSTIINYMIYRGNTAGGETLLATIGNVLTYVDTGVINNQTYYYKVSAVNDVGEGAYSNEITATPSTTIDDDSTDTGDDNASSILFPILAVMVIIAVISGVVFTLKRKPKKPGPSTGKNQQPPPENN